MTFLRYLVGATALLVSLAFVVSGARAVREWCLPDWQGPLDVLVVSVLSLTSITVISEALGTIGWFHFVPLAVAFILVGFGARALARRRPARVRGGAVDEVADVGADPATNPTFNPTINWVVGIAVAVVCAEWVVATVRSFEVGMTAVDGIWYHMPTAVRFVQSGSTWQLHTIDTTSLTSFYPAGSELLHAVGIAFLNADALSHVLNLGWLALGLLAAWCIGARFRVGPLALLGAALLFATPQLVNLEAGQALNDMAVTALLVAAVAIIVNAVQFDRGELLATAPLVVGAMAAGLAVGAKWTALVPVAVLTVGIVFLIRRGARVRGVLVWLGVVIVTGGYWYLRNLVAVGSPIPPQRLAIGPFELEYVRPGISTFTITHYFGDSDVLHHEILPGLRGAFGPVWWSVLALAAAGLVGALFGYRDRAVKVGAAVGLACVLSYVFTKQGFNVTFWPGTPRYAAPGLALGLILLPVALTRISRRAALISVPVYAVVLFATQFAKRLWPAWWPVSHHFVVVGSIVMVVAIGLGVVAVFAGRVPNRRPRHPALLGGIALVVLAIAAGVALDNYQPRFAAHGTPGEAVARFLRARDPDHARIALTGSLLVTGSQYAFYDKRFTNVVHFISQRGPHHTAVAFTSCPAFVQAVNDGRYRYVIAAPTTSGGVNPATWLATDPGAERIGRNAHLGAAVYEIRGTLDPDACPSST